MISKITYVAYYRVSTQKQGQSGLGLAAQKEIVKNYIAKNKLLNEYTEIESGRKKNRTELNKAIAQCKDTKATLIIAKLDRLARNVSFVFALRESGINFVACDLPDFNTLTLGVFASFAQFEAERISQRTKDALAAKKRQGFKLGSPKPMLETVRAKGRQALAQKSKDAMELVYKCAKDFRNCNKSLREIAANLNSYGYKTKTGKAFQATSVLNLFKLFETGSVRNSSLSLAAKN